MRLSLLTIGLLLSISCSMKHLRPSDYVYAVLDGKACYYKTLEDLAKKDKITCKEWKELEGWLVIHPVKLKEVMTRGLDELSTIQKASPSTSGNNHGVIYKKE
jgi:hypothetical protein